MTNYEVQEARLQERVWEQLESEVEFYAELRRISERDGYVLLRSA